MTEDKHWYVSYVRSCREKIAAEKLAFHGYEYYLPVQRVVRQWSDRKKIVERLVLPRMIFIRCTETERLRSLDLVSDLFKYITIKGPFTASIIPDTELEAFRMMVERGSCDVNVVGEHFSPGDKVRVVSGPLEGFECELLTVGGKRCVAVRIGFLGTATMDINIDTIQKI